MQALIILVNLVFPMCMRDKVSNDIKPQSRRLHKVVPTSAVNVLDIAIYFCLMKHEVLTFTFVISHRPYSISLNFHSSKWPATNSFCITHYLL